MSASPRERRPRPSAQRPTDLPNDLTIRTAAVEPVVMLQFSGVLGLIDAGLVISTVAQALRSAPGGVVVCDVSRLTVLQTSALSVFPTAIRRVGGWPSYALHLAAPGPVLDVQLLSMRMGRYLPVHAALDDALIAAEFDVVLERCEVPLPPVAASVPRAREALQTLYPAGYGDPGRHDALVVVSELATNAVQHVTEPFTVAMVRSPGRLVLAVHDPSSQEPIVRPPRRSASCGRGMYLVAELSDDWGVRLNRPRGKTVWACLPPPRPPRRSAPVPPGLATR
jgi:hypothetical protein